MGLDEVRPELHLLDRRSSSATSRRSCCTRCSAPGFIAHFLSYIYLWFLPLVPLASPRG
jgi:hypothetical protein